MSHVSPKARKTFVFKVFSSHFFSRIKHRREESNNDLKEKLDLLVHIYSGMFYATAYFFLKNITAIFQYAFFFFIYLLAH